MKRNHFTPYSVLDELMASDSQPLPAEKRTYQLMRMRQQEGRQPCLTPKNLPTAGT